ncbi:MAG: protein kinase [Planctomycetes bacterium]|nr:protein kinase [Planctomycetota bacterium]
MKQPEKLGPYRIERPLGRGGMGAVYVGLNKETGERAAVKVLAPAFATERNFRGRFAAEIDTLKKLRHPNIVQLYGFGEEEGTLFYAMQLIEGDNLEVEVRKGRHFDWREVIAIGLDVCKALKHAHDRGIIHRDLKPANLLRGDDGRILLSDFGIAKLFGGAELTAAGGVVGTVDYMAPEQAAGEGVTHRSDLYSLGGTLFCLLAGRPPFQGRAVPDIIHQVRFSEAPLVGRFAPTTPVELENIIGRLLEKDPKKRIPTPLALTNLLQTMAHSEPQTIIDPDPLGEEESPSDEFTLATKVPSTPDLAPELSAVQPTSLVDAEPRMHATGNQEETVVHTAPPSAAEEEEEDEPEAPASRFTTVSQEELGKLEGEAPLGEEESFGWIKLAGAATAIVAFMLFGWYASRPPSADQLYETILQTVEERDASAADDGIAEFLARFPGDARVSEIDAFRQEAEVVRLERVMERRARGSRLGDGMTLVERTYLKAMQTARTDPQLAAEQLASLIAVFGTAPEQDDAAAACVELAKKQLERLRQSVERSSEDNRTALKKRLAVAEELWETDPAAAQEIWRGVVALYPDREWAEPLVAEAQRRLNSEIAKTGGKAIP